MQDPFIDYNVIVLREGVAAGTPDRRRIRTAVDFEGAEGVSRSSRASGPMINHLDAHLLK